jgi:hypothetical protein
VTIFGWDASDFDWPRGPMDLGAAVRDGITFFSHKATEGTRTQHVHYREALERARSAGMPFVGAYIVVRTPGHNGHGSVQQQVNYFLTYLDTQTPWWRNLPEFFIQVDLEHWGYDDVAPQYGVQACDLLRAQTGKWVAHYAPRWAYGDTIGGGHPLWASAYGSNPAVPYRQAYPGDASSAWTPYSGRTPTILQYGSRAQIGSQPGCDANAYRGSLAELRALITGGSMAGEADKAFSAPYVRGDEPWISGQSWASKALEGPLRDVNRKMDDLAGKVGTIQAAGAPTQEQVDAAILKAMLSPAVVKGIGDAIASHIHVS